MHTNIHTYIHTRTSSSNPWSQVYKLATGKPRTSSVMTTLRKPDGTETSSLQETMNIMLDNTVLQRQRKTSNLPP
jgi:coproporphyrinogen III oxidase-like Fe-S oxidoreductase